MKKISLLLLFVLASSLSVVAQQKITLEEIWGGAFRTKGMDELNAMKNTNMPQTIGGLNRFEITRAQRAFI